MYFYSRFDSIITAFADNVKLFASSSNDKSRKELAEFKSQWNCISQGFFLFIKESARLGILITTEKVGEIDKEAYEKALETIYTDNLKRQQLLNAMENRLKEVEKERAVKVTEQMTHVVIALQSLNFQHPATIEKMIQVLLFNLE